MTAERYTIRELSEEWTRSGAQKGNGVEGFIKKRRYPVPDWFGRNPEYLANHKSPTHLLDHWNDKTATDRPAVLSSINDMVQLANYRRARAQFIRTKPTLALAILIAAAGVCVFAWAANPDKAPPAAMRNADLSKSDLRGVSLVNADLTGVDFSDANLRGADLTDADLTNVVWHNTICPDGTNSDETAGKRGKPSCRGHLSPP